MTKFWYDDQGLIICATSEDYDSYPNAVGFTELAPDSGYQKWNGAGWETLPSRNALAEISRLESTVTPRRLREAIADPTWLNDIDAQIAVLRGKL